MKQVVPLVSGLLCSRAAFMVVFCRTGDPHVRSVVPIACWQLGWLVAKRIKSLGFSSQALIGIC